MTRPSQDFRLSRVQAAGWTAAHKLPNLAELDEAGIAALNPHRLDPERARWYAGFKSALATLETR